jgi:hypothetical protein
MVRSIGRVGAIVALAVVAMLGGAGTAAADPPETFTESDTFVDPFLSELCGTEITVSYTFTLRTVFFEEGSDVPHQHLATFSATLTGPGGSLIEREAWREYDTGDSATTTGLPFHLRSSDGGVVIRDAGYVTFTEDGDIAVVHGPHPFLFEEFDPCPYLV